MGTRYQWDEFVLDLDSYRLERGGARIPLEPKAFNLLVLMVRRPGHLFTKQELFDAVWPDTAVTDHALTRVVAQLRRALGDDVRDARYLETVPTRGYRWIRPVDEPKPIELLPAVAAPVPAEATAVPRHRSAAPRRVPAVASMLVLGAAVLGLLVWTQRSTRTSATAAGGERTREAATSTAARREQPWPVQLTTNAGLDAQPVLSPQGDAIAFVSDRSGAFEIHVRALGGTARETALTSDGGQNVQPAWSGDGRFLAYHSNRGGGIWSIPARGGTPRQVTASGSSPAWSPDSSRIAFQSDEDTDVFPHGYGAQSGSNLLIVGADGNGLRELTKSGHPMGGHASPAWSPDGRYVAFVVFDGGSNNGIWILNAATLETTQLERGPGLYDPVFAPDGSAVYAAGGEALIVRVPFDAATAARRGTRDTIPIAGVSGVRGLTMSADGRRLGFAGLSTSSQLWAQPVSPDGSPNGEAVALTRDTSRRNSVPSISPDGSKIAYMSLRRGELPNVWLMDIDGRNALQLTSDETAEHQPKWFPDGQRIAYPSNRGTVRGVWSVNIRTRREELLFDMARTRDLPPTAAPLKGRLAELDLAPSMRNAAFTLVVPPLGRRVLYVAGLDPFAPRALTDDSRSIGYPAWSRDERYIAVEEKDGSSTHAAIIDVRSGAMRRLTSERGQTWVRSWSRDGRKVAAAVLRDGAWSLRAFDVATGGQVTIVPPAAPGVFVRYPEWSPLGKVVVYERGETHGNIWMLTVN